MCVYKEKSNNKNKTPNNNKNTAWEILEITQQYCEKLQILATDDNTKHKFHFYTTTK